MNTTPATALRPRLDGRDARAASAHASLQVSALSPDPLASCLSEPTRIAADRAAAATPIAADHARDAEMIAACVAGDRDAWAMLVTEHRAGVAATIRATLARHTGRAEPAVVEDIEASLFLGLWVDDCRRLRAFRGASRLSTWLRVLAVNATTDALRRERATVPIGFDAPLELPCDAPDPERRALAEERAAQLGELWSELPPPDAAFAQMFFVAGLDFDEIAARTGATVGALYARKLRIQRRLRLAAVQRGWVQPTEPEEVTV